MARRSLPSASRWVAKLWRRACGVAVSGRPITGRRPRICFCATAAFRRPPRIPTNSGPSSDQGIGAGGDIGLKRLPHHGQHGNHPLLAALAGDHQRLARHVAAVQAQRLVDSQAAAIQQGEQRPVALADPGLIGPFLGGCQKIGGIAFGQRLWQTRRQFGSLQQADSGIVHAAASIQPAEEIADTRQRAGTAGRPQPSRSLPRQPSAKIDQMGVAQVAETMGTALVAGQEFQKAGEIGGIGAERMARYPLFHLQPPPPRRDSGADILGAGEAEDAGTLYSGRSSHARILRSITRARKQTSSVP